MKRFLVIAMAAVLAFGGQIAQAAEIGVWAMPEGYKVDKFGKKIFVLDEGQKIAELKQKNRIWDSASGIISIGGARGETVAFQLGIEGGQAGLEDADVRFNDLVPNGGKKIPAGLIELFKIYYTRLKGKGSGPTNKPSMGEGWYPDALVPWSIGDVSAYGGYDGPPFAVSADEIQGVWIDVSIPYGTQAGIYTGVVKITAKGAAPKELTLKLTVYNFDLPRKIHNTFFMNFNMPDLNQAGGNWLTGDKVRLYEDEVYRISRRHRFTAGNMYITAHPNIVEKPDGGLTSADWAGYDRDFDKVLNPTNNIFGPGEDAIEVWRAPVSGPIGSAAPWPKNPKTWDDMVVEIKNHWKAKGWDISRAYVYLADEPDPAQAALLNDMAGRIKKSPGPNLRRQIAVYTILGEKWESQKRIFDLWRDNLDMWMVAGDYYYAPEMNGLPANCLKGMYQGAEPFQGNETLDADGVALRTWSWIAWMYRIDFQCYYSMCGAWRGYDLENKKAFNQNNCEIWDQPRNRSWAVSQGVFIYPGKRVNYDLPIVNIRMKQIRRGQTDYEYFWLLRQAGEGALADRLAKQVIKAALSESGSQPGHEYGSGKWSHDPGDWDGAVRQAAKRLEELAAKLPKEPVSLAGAQPKKVSLWHVGPTAGK